MKMTLAQSANDNAAVTLRVYDPTGLADTTQSYASRLEDLNGRTVCELSNGVWEDQRSFPVIRALIQERFPRARIIPFTEFPVGTERMDRDSTIDLLVEKGCEALITGNAA
jgi:hypothetical protein